MSKRGLQSTPSPKKKPKLQHNQAQLDHFFSTPKTKVGTPEKKGNFTPQFVQGSSRQAANSTPRVSITIDSSNVIDVDAFEPETAKTLPQSPKGPRASSSISVKKEALVVRGNEAISRTNLEQFTALDIDPVQYQPEQQPSQSREAPYSLLTHALIALSQTKSRISIIKILTNVLRTMIIKHPSSLLPAVYLLSNSLGPSFIPIELGLGSSIISRSIQQISGLTPAALKKLYNTTGDPGDVAFEAKSNIRTLIPHPPLSVPYVYESMLKITRSKGQGAAKEKQKIVEKLLLAATGEEVRYLTRTLCQNLRVGAVRSSILTSLARAFVLTPPVAVECQMPQDSPSTSLHVSSTLLLDLKTQMPSKSKGKNPDTLREKLSATFKLAENLIKRVYVKHPSYDQIIPTLLEYGLDSLAERVPLTVGIPLHPMLGSPTRSLDEIYNRLGDLPFSAEFKYDGQRAQIHAYKTSEDSQEVKIFSRHLEDMTSKYPDITSLVKSVFEASPDMTSFIMDSEIVAIDPTSSELKSFQELSGRARKDVNIRDIRIHVCVYAFDLMYLNGKSILDQSFQERRKLLHSNFQTRKIEGSAYFDFVKSCESTEGKSAIEEFLLNAVESKCEGLMIKVLDSSVDTDSSDEKKSRLKSLPSTYEPDVRASGWLKLKKDYVEGMGDSLDLIPVGAWYGNGRKVKWWSPVLLALWDPEKGRPVAVCKCMSGFTDTFYASMRETYSLDSEMCSKQPKWECEYGGFKPDVYFKPSVVWEIRGADITESPISVAAQGIVSSSRGLSLRFPRFIKVRDDKHIENASTTMFLAEMWRSQQKKTETTGNDEGDLVDAEDETSDLVSDSGEEDGDQYPNFML